MSRPHVAIFRPDDGRTDRAVERLESLGAEPIPDPMLAVEPTGATPRTDAEYVVFTSVTGVSLLPDGWTPDGAALCAIGERTADALRDAGYDVAVVPGTYSSRGLVDALSGRAEGARVEVARSDHGSGALPAGLDDVGAYHHETVLYRLVRPTGAGASAEMAARGDLDAALFTSSLTVEHFLDAARERGVGEEAIEGLAGTVIGAIGEPTRETAEAAGIEVDVVPDEATFDALAGAATNRLGTEA